MTIQHFAFNVSHNRACKEKKKKVGEVGKDKRFIMLFMASSVICTAYILDDI